MITSVFIGRFQPFHNGHKTVIDHMITESDRCLILVGSSFQEPTARNPFSFYLREEMILNHYGQPANMACLPIEDTVDDESWYSKVREVVNLWKLPNSQIVLYGNIKDETSEYLNHFPEWDRAPLSFGILNATDIRADFFNNGSIRNLNVPDSTKEVLSVYQQTRLYQHGQEMFLCGKGK